MDYFDATVARILEEQGYWVRQSVRVLLSKETRKNLGKPSLPRSEVDIVAYQPTRKILLLLEVKSYLDSHGVQPKDLLNTGWAKNRYKLLTIPALQREISDALVSEYRRQGLIGEGVEVKFGLAAGHVKKALDEQVRRIADRNKWAYYGPKEIADEVWKFSKLKYENSPFVLTAKLLRQHPPKPA